MRDALIVLFVVIDAITLFALSRRVGELGGFRGSLRAFVDGQADSKPILLFLCAFPLAGLGAVSILVLVHLQPAYTLTLVLISLCSLVAILGLYWLNGWLMVRIRKGVQRGFDLWKYFGLPEI